MSGDQGPRGGAARRLGLMTIDQVIAGASNVLIAVLAAQLLSAEEFGLFGIVFLVYTLLVGVTRALVSDPLLVHPEEVEDRSGEAIGATCVLALPLSVGLAGVGLALRVWSPGLGDAMMVLAACMPLLLLQDIGRYLGFATQRPGAAVLLDSVWLVLMVASIAVAFSVTDERSLPLLIAAWGGSGAAAGLMVATRYRLREVRLRITWLRYTWSLSWRYLLQYMSMQGSALATSSFVGGIAGARALGGVQGALLLTRPFSTFQSSAVTAAVAEIARFAGDQGRILKHAFFTSGVTGTAAVLTAAAMVVMPNGVGEAVLADAWDPAEPLLLPTGIYIVFSGLLAGPAAALLGIRAMREATAIYLVMGVVSVIAATLGAIVNGALGAMWFAAGAQALAMLLWWSVFSIRIRNVGALDQADAVPSAAATGTRS